jgi:hypothetical protein
MNLDDVAVAGDHQAFIGVVVDGVIVARDEADFGGALTGDIEDLARLEGPDERTARSSLMMWRMALSVGPEENAVPVTVRRWR